jgi:hypothetical protein
MIVSPNTPFQGTNYNGEVAVIKSTDGGVTWSAPTVIAPFDSLGVIDPNTGQRLRVGDGLPEAAIDPATGQLYVVWESSSNYLKNLKQSSGSWDDEVLLSTSPAGGASWSKPVVVHRAGGMPTFIPTVAVGSGGTVAVTYYDTRRLSASNTTTLPTDYWISYSAAGGASFGNEQHLAGPFDALSAPSAGGFFLGDYEALAAMGGSFEAFFVKTNCNLSASDPNAVPVNNPACGPARSTANQTSNTNPTDVFAATATP